MGEANEQVVSRDSSLISACLLSLPCSASVSDSSAATSVILQADFEFLSCLDLVASRKNFSMGYPSEKLLCGLWFMQSWT
jgi:hypothetical protein